MTIEALEEQVQSLENERDNLIDALTLRNLDVKAQLSLLSECQEVLSKYQDQCLDFGVVRLLKKLDEEL